MQYSELTAAIQNYCQNSESTFVSHLNDFILAAENKIFSAVELPSHWKAVLDTALVDGTPEYSLGSGVVQVESVRVSESATAAQAGGVEFGPVRYLLLKDYDFLLEAYPGSATAAGEGVPKYYSISSTSVTSSNPDLKIRLAPEPDDAYRMTVTYLGKASSDSITNGSTAGNETWLSVTFPDCLLWGSICEAYAFMKGEPDLIQLYEKRFLDSLTLLKNTVENRSDSDAYRPINSPITPLPQGQQ